MHFSWTALFVVICFSGIHCVTLPLQFEEEIDNISDSSDDILKPRPQEVLLSANEEYEKERVTKKPEKDDKQQVTKEQEPCPDPKVYGMNIGLHYILEDINKRLYYGDRVHLESLIKVLVLTHKIEKAGGTVELNNQQALSKVAQLYPEALRNALTN